MYTCTPHPHPPPQIEIIILVLKPPTLFQSRVNICFLIEKNRTSQNNQLHFSNGYLWQNKTIEEFKQKRFNKYNYSAKKKVFGELNMFYLRLKDV